MNLVAAEYFMELDGIVLQRDTLGSALKVQREDVSFSIEIPSAPNQYKFGSMTVANVLGDERVYTPTLAFIATHDDSRLVEVRIIRVLINTEVALSADTYDDNDPEHNMAINEVFWKLWKHAHDSTHEFIDNVRAHGQPWIEPNGRYPRVLNTVELIDVTLRRSFGFRIGQALDGFRVVDESGILSAQRLSEIERIMQDEGPPSVGEVLVSDAFYLADSEQGNGPSQATLLAAMGVEVKTKAVLRLLAGEDKQELLDLLLENPRDWSLSAHGLFAKALPTLAGRALREDHRELAKQVQKLFNARNRVAHRGEIITRQEGAQHVNTAQAAIQFLRSLEAAATE